MSGVVVSFCARFRMNPFPLLKHVCLLIFIVMALYTNPNHLNQKLLGREDLKRLSECIMEQIDAQGGLRDRITADFSDVVLDLAKASGFTTEQEAMIQAIYENRFVEAVPFIRVFRLGRRQGMAEVIKESLDLCQIL